MDQTFKARPAFISFLRLTRVGNLVIIALSQYFIAIKLIGFNTLYDWKLFVLSLSTALIAGAGYIINDYYDVKIDLVNKPERVVIGQGITRRYAILYHSMLSIIGVGLGLIVNWKIGVINFGCVFLLWWYSNDLKRHPLIGNLVVSMLTGVAIVLVDAIFKSGNNLIVSYAIFAFVITLIREIIKDMEDLKGDDTFGCKTLPIVWGIRKTKFFLYFLTAVLASVFLALNLIYKQLPDYLIIVLLPLLLWLTYRLIKADTKKDFEWLSMFCKVIMLLGILSLIFV